MSKAFLIQISLELEFALLLPKKVLLYQGWRKLLAIVSLSIRERLVYVGSLSGRRDAHLHRVQMQRMHPESQPR